MCRANGFSKNRTIGEKTAGVTANSWATKSVDVTECALGLLKVHVSLKAQI